MRRYWVLAVVVVAALTCPPAHAQGSINWHTALPEESIETIFFRDCRISVRFGCVWTFQDRTWTVFFPEDRIVARKIDGYYKQINFEDLRCASRDIGTVRCRIISVPFDRTHMLFIDPVVTGATGQTWRIDPPTAIRYDR